MNGEVNTRSNSIWENADNFYDFEARRLVLFRDDMQEQFFRWFRIKPSDYVLDGGCATGSLTRCIGKGLDTGFIIGFELSQTYVDIGNQKIVEEGLSDKVKIVREDGYSLSFADNTFDAVINHTYLGVLSDVKAGLNELIRVCKPGGHVSASCSTRNWQGNNWAGDNPFAGQSQLNELNKKYESIWQKICPEEVYSPAAYKQDEYWITARYPRLFAKCGLKNITLHPYASGFSYNDSYWTDEVKEHKIQSDTERNIQKLMEARKNVLYAEYGFTQKDFDELIALHRQKQAYLLSSIHDDDCWEWYTNLHLIIAGTKA